MAVYYSRLPKFNLAPRAMRLPDSVVQAPDTNLNGCRGNLARLVEIQRENLSEARSIDVETGAAVAERFQQQKDGIQLFHCWNKWTDGFNAK